MTKLERIDMIIKVSLLLSHLALPKEWHVNSAVHNMAYVGQNYNPRLVCIPSCIEIDHRVLKKCNWSDFYQDADEAVPVNAQKPKFKEVDFCRLVDNDHS